MENVDQIIDAINNFGSFKGILKTDEPLAQKSTFKIGGNAKLFIAPENFNSFQFVLETLVATNTKFFIIGGGSNIVFPDETYDGVILSTQEFCDVSILKFDNLPFSMQDTKLESNQVLVTCFAGTPVATVVNFCTKNNLTGFEEFAGLPGSIGGALYMNARCFEKSISELLFYTSYMDYSSGKIEVKKLPYKESDFDYKKSPFQNQKRVVTTATFLVTKQPESEHQNIEEKCKEFIAERVTKGHFRYPSAGSVFKNNHDFGKPSGKLIDEAGLKGYTIGGAQIADFHGNFIVNTNNAKATDVKALVEYAEKIILEKYGFTLEPEIIFVDD